LTLSAAVLIRNRWPILRYAVEQVERLAAALRQHMVERQVPQELFSRLHLD